MRFTQIPLIENTWNNVTIKTLSPSTFSWLIHGCGYQVLLQKALLTFNNNTLILPSNQNAIIGTIIHKLYELTQKGELRGFVELKNKWEELIATEKCKLATNYPTLRNLSINNYDKRNRAIRYAMAMLRRSNNNIVLESGANKVYSEKWLDCSELGLRGVADKLIINNDYVDIIDFKSGYVKDEDGNIKDEYQIQLHLYAAMCYHLSLGKPRSLYLIDIEGAYFEVPYSLDLSNKLLDEVKDALKLLNEIVTNRNFHSLAKPNQTLCSYCSCRHVCQYREIPVDSFYQTITGKVVEIPSSNMYVLQSSHNILYVSGMDVYQVESPKDYMGKTLVFVNITRASQIADNYTYKITESTLVYEQL